MSQDIRPNTVIWFDGPEAYADYLYNIPGQYKNIYDRRFSGGPFDLALSKLVNGDREGLDKAQAIIDKMSDQQIFSVGRPSIESGPVGFMPNVPNAIMGQPNDMFNIVQVEDETLTAPLRIFVETTVSAGLTQDSHATANQFVMGKASRDPLAEALQRAKELSTRMTAATRSKGGPAEKAGIEASDVILKFDGKNVASSSDLPRIVAQSRPGSKVTAQIWRKGASRDVAITVGEMPEERVAQRTGRNSTSRTRRRIRFAIRGVPRARRAISSAASGSTSTSRIFALRRTIAASSTDE
jgi:hypothetical protein